MMHGIVIHEKKEHAMINKRTGICIILILLFSVVNHSCRNSGNPVQPSQENQNTHPWVPIVVIGTPRLEAPYNIVGSDTVLDVGFGVARFPYEWDYWPPPRVDRIECFIDGRRVTSYRPDEVIHPDEMNYEEMIYIGEIADPSSFEEYSRLYDFWTFSCGRGLTANDFGTPGHNKKLTVRVWNGNVYGEDTILFDYDDAELDQVACEYIKTNPWVGGVSFSTRRIYYATQGTVIDDLIDTTLRWMGKRLGIAFVRTNDLSLYPVLYFLKNQCCGIMGGDYGRYVVPIGADTGVVPPNFWAIPGYARIICHETGHGIGLPHDNEKQYLYSCMQAGRNQLILYPFQQRAFRMLLERPEQCSPPPPKPP